MSEIRAENWFRVERNGEVYAVFAEAEKSREHSIVPQAGSFVRNPSSIV